MQFVPNSAGSEDLREFNPCHHPGGSPAGGQFCATGGSSAAAPSRGRSTGRGPVRSGRAALTDIGREAVALRDAGVPLHRVFSSVKASVLRRAETPEERQHAGLIARMEIETAFELRDGDSKWKHTRVDPKTGHRVYTDARLDLHVSILDKLQNPNAKPVMEGQPVAVFSGGLPASGKTAAMGGLEKSEFGQSAQVISNDKVKTYLPGYRGHNAHVYHEESGDVAEELFQASANLRKNILYDFTFRNEDTMRARIEYLKARGYRVEVRFTDVDVNTSVAAAIHRVVKEETAYRAKSGGTGFAGRYIPLDHIRKALRFNADGSRTSQNAQTLKTLRPLLDAYVSMDNNGVLGWLRKKTLSKPVFQHGRGKLTGPSPGG